MSDFTLTTTATTDDNSTTIVDMSSSSTLCLYGDHYFSYGNALPEDGVPDGQPCKCGQTRYNKRESLWADIGRIKRQLTELEDRI